MSKTKHRSDPPTGDSLRGLSRSHLPVIARKAPPVSPPYKLGLFLLYCEALYHLPVRSLLLQLAWISLYGTQPKNCSWNKLGIGAALWSSQQGAHELFLKLSVPPLPLCNSAPLPFDSNSPKRVDWFHLLLSDVHPFFHSAWGNPLIVPMQMQSTLNLFSHSLE